MGTFIICWFPFFLVNVISGLVTNLVVPEIVFQVKTINILKGLNIAHFFKAKKINFHQEIQRNIFMVYHFAIFLH